MLKMLYETNNFGRLVRAISGKITAFLIDETTVMFFLSVSGNIVLLKIPKRFFGGWFFMEVFLKFFFSFWSDKHTSFHLCIQSWDRVFYKLQQKDFLSSMRYLKNSFCSQILSRHNIAIWKIFPKKMSAVLRLMVVSFLWRPCCNSYGSEAMKTCWERDHWTHSACKIGYSFFCNEFPKDFFWENNTSSGGTLFCLHL